MARAHMLDTLFGPAQTAWELGGFLDLLYLQARRKNVGSVLKTDI